MKLENMRRMELWANLGRVPETLWPVRNRLWRQLEGALAERLGGSVVSTYRVES